MKYSIRKLFLVTSVLCILLAIIVPSVQLLRSWYGGNNISNQMNFVTLNGGAIEMDGDLRSVSMSDTKLKNEDLVHLRRLNPYHEIDISGTSIDDFGLPGLYGVRADRIDLSGTNVSGSGVNLLKQNVKSSCVIVWAEANPN